MRFPLLHPGLSNRSILSNWLLTCLCNTVLEYSILSRNLTSPLTKLYYISLSSLWLNIISRIFLQMICKKDTNFMFKISIKKKIKQEKSSFLIWHISLLFHRYKSYIFLNKSFSISQISNLPLSEHIFQVWGGHSMDIVCDVLGVVHATLENLRQIRDKGGHGWRETGVEVLVQIH